MADDNFGSPNHALRTGGLLGELMKAGIDVHPIADDDGDFTDVIVLNFPEFEVAVRVLPPGVRR